MQIKYINHLNEEIDLSQPPYLLETSDAFDFSWDHETSAVGDRGISVANFKRSSKEMMAQIVIKCDDFEDALNHFFEITEKDITAKKPGKLVAKSGEYLPCYIVRSKHTFINLQNKTNIRELTILSPHPFWLKEKSHGFYPITKPQSESFLDYSYDYSYDYTPPAGGIEAWDTGHYATSEFEMVVFGPCLDPRILINGHVYTFYDTVEAGEYVIINSREKSIIKHRTNNTTKDLFDYRGKEDSVFEPIPGGVINVMWMESFGFDLTLFQERSEPAW